MKPRQWQVVQWAALTVVILAGLALWFWWSCSSEARAESRMELYGEDAR